jgi:hypothetical protein
LLRRLELGEVLGATAQLAVAVGVAAGCDIVRDDTGLFGAILLGLAVGNLRGFDVPARRPFLETMVQLIIGLLFISISATVTPSSVRSVLLPALGLSAVLIVLVRPLVAAISTARSELTRPERIFVGWMAPRGIVAAATASTFGATLASAGVGGAEKILPTTFLVIVVAVTVYGLTARPVARRVGVVRPARTRPLLVGGTSWVVDLARVLRELGLDALMWAPTEAQRTQVRGAGLELASGELLAAATGRGAQLEGVTMVLLLTDEDDFNALAAFLLVEAVDGPVYRVGQAETGAGVVAPYLEGEVLFDEDLDRAVLTRRYDVGERIVHAQGEEVAPPGSTELFVIRADGRLVPVTRTGRPTSGTSDVRVLLAPAPSRVPSEAARGA